MSLDGQYDPENIFAKILRGEMPCVKVYEDEHVLAFMDLFPQAPGHTLVVPREPVRNALEMSDGALQATIVRVKRIANAVKTALKPDGIVITQFNGAPAGQTIFHVHFHIIPRREGEALGAHGGRQADTGRAQAPGREDRRGDRDALDGPLRARVGGDRRARIRHGAPGAPIGRIPVFALLEPELQRALDDSAETAFRSDMRRGTAHQVIRKFDVERSTTGSRHA